MNFLNPQRYQNNNYHVVDNNTYQPVKNMHDYYFLINSMDTKELYPPAGVIMYKQPPLKTISLPSQNGVSFKNYSAKTTYRQNNVMVVPTVNRELRF